LTGIKVIELGGIGPGVYAGMLLADLGADVVRVERPLAGTQSSAPSAPSLEDQARRGHRTVTADLRDPEQRAALLAAAQCADVLIEGARPGVAERLGVGPDQLCDLNPRLVYARVTGFGQDGPWAQRPGHDINFIAITGTLNALRTPGERPLPPLNLMSYAGGSLFLVLGVLAALWEREQSGRGQVVDAAVVDGATSLLQQVWTLRGRGDWKETPASNILDGGAPFNDTYLCSDGRYVAFGGAEPEFFATLLASLGLDPELLAGRDNPQRWPELRRAIADGFATRTRDEWVADLPDAACVTPVLDVGEALQHPHLVARRTHIEIDGVPQTNTAPRFSRSVPARPRPPQRVPDGLVAIVAEWQGGD
jgi:alpha-methylacyl-CoA racemase